MDQEFAVSLQAADRIGEAIILEEKPLKLKREHLSRGHAYTRESMDNLATYYEKTGRTKEAQVLRKEPGDFEQKPESAKPVQALKKGAQESKQ